MTHTVLAVTNVKAGTTASITHQSCSTIANVNTITAATAVKAVASNRDICFRLKAVEAVPGGLTAVEIVTAAQNYKTTTGVKFVSVVKTVKTFRTFKAVTNVKAGTASFGTITVKASPRSQLLESLQLPKLGRICHNSHTAKAAKPNCYSYLSRKS